MFKPQLYFLAVGMFLLTSIGIGIPPEKIRLSNDLWDVEIILETLAVNAYPAHTDITIGISSGQTGLGSATALSQEIDTATWKLPERFLTLHTQLTADSLSFEFVQDAPANDTRTLVWPIIEDTEPIHAYIFPFFEGSYVPKHDQTWQDFLTEQGPINTTAGLSMPFWGLDLRERTLTYILTNPFNNQILFDKTEKGAALGMQVSHTFTPNWEEKRYGLRISLTEASPVAPAKKYRRWLQQEGEFVPFAEKIKQTPEAEKLLGAAHAYLWGGKLLSRYDVTDWKTFAVKLNRGGDQWTAQNVESRLFSQLNAAARKALQEIAQSDRPSNYALRVMSRAISKQLEKPNFYNPTAWLGISLTPETQELCSRVPATLSLTELYRRNVLLLYAAFPNVLRHPDEWGDGFSVKLLQRLSENGLDRLWLGLDTWQEGFRHPAAVAKAKRLGYLVAPYDSYHSIHPPNEKDTWETAQFDASLYESGAIVNADGTKSKGFKQKGYHLSPIAAKPYVENRVNSILAQMPNGFNSWFIDCDAYGELFDDYSPSHPATQLDDMKARLARMTWIRNTHDLVVGSEGGSAYAAGTIHFAHGMMSPVIGWGDPDMNDKNSPYYVGGYWPPEAPAIHVKQVPLKSRYFYLYYDPRFRLPLYQTVFHDSVITTHHWGYSSLKFKNAVATVALLELLYNVPPLYHLNIPRFSKHRKWIKRYYAFFSPLHRQIGGQPMTHFEWISPDRLIQRTTFSDTVEIFANFGAEPFEHRNVSIPEQSVLARWIATGKTAIFSVE